MTNTKDAHSSWFGRLFGGLFGGNRRYDLTAEQSRLLIEELKRRTAVHAVKINAKSAKNLPLGASKFGGVPYWNPVEPYPTDEEGNKLALLAQIDLANVPHLPDFPNTGLLQFFIAPGDGYGMGSPKGHRVIWHEIVDASVTEEAIIALDIPTTRSLENKKKRKYLYLPLFKEYELCFELTETFDAGTFEFDKTLEASASALGLEIPNDWHISEYIDTDTYEELLVDVNNGHWIGGYPCFTQEDPRQIDGYAAYTTLLLQIDSEDDIMWGDAGVGNFFIRPEDLRKRDFSKVFYTWDCT